MARGGAPALASVPLFSRVSKRHLKRVAESMREEHVEEGLTIAEEGKSGEVFYVILQGEAKVIRRGRAISHLLPGDFFGEIALLDGGVRTASVVAETPMTLLSLGRRQFRRVLEQEPTLVLAMLEELARRLRNQERALTS